MPTWVVIISLRREILHYPPQEAADTTSISMGFQKPNSLKYSNLMDEYGSALARDAEVWSDKALLPLIKCHDIRERIRDSLFALYKTGDTFNMSPFQVDMNVQAFQIEVEEFKRSIQKEIKSLRRSYSYRPSKPVV